MIGTVARTLFDWVGIFCICGIVVGTAEDGVVGCVEAVSDGASDARGVGVKVGVGRFSSSCTASCSLVRGSVGVGVF